LLGECINQFLNPPFPSAVADQGSACRDSPLGSRPSSQIRDEEGGNTLFFLKPTLLSSSLPFPPSPEIEIRDPFFLYAAPSPSPPARSSRLFFPPSTVRVIYFRKPLFLPIPSSRRPFSSLNHDVVNAAFFFSLLTFPFLLPSLLKTSASSLLPSPPALSRDGRRLSFLIFCSSSSSSRAQRFVFLFSYFPFLAESASARYHSPRLLPPPLIVNHPVTSPRVLPLSPPPFFLEALRRRSLRFPPFPLPLCSCIDLAVASRFFPSFFSAPGPLQIPPHDPFVK